MNIPSRLNVAGIIYDVREVPFIEVDGNRNYQGACEYGKTEITILKDISRERKEDVFVHELAHAIFYEAGFEDQNEDVINRVGKVLHQVLVTNPFFEFE